MSQVCFSALRDPRVVVLDYPLQGVSFALLLQATQNIAQRAAGLHSTHRGLTLDTRRELGTIELQVKTEKNPDSVPVTYRRESICMVHLKACSITRDERFRRFQPEGTDWVVERKKQHIKGKLQDKFPSAEKCFSALDEDGGGSLDR